eukprot:571076-Prorocentrum_lima.AAC.1
MLYLPTFSRSEQGFGRCRVGLVREPFTRQASEQGDLVSSLDRCGYTAAICRRKRQTQGAMGR